MKFLFNFFRKNVYIFKINIKCLYVLGNILNIGDIIVNMRCIVFRFYGVYILVEGVRISGYGVGKIGMNR